MNILVCIPCLMLGGSEIATLQMVQALVEDGYSVRVVVYYESDPVMVARYHACGAKIALLHEQRSGIAGMLRLMFRLVKLFRQEHPDVVHVQYFAPGMIPICAARLAGIRTIFATVHAAGGNGYGWKAKAMFRISSSLTSHFFCVAENTERFWFGKVGTGHHSTLHNGIDIARFMSAAPLRISEIEFHTTLVIGIVGRVVRLKGHDCLFRAVHNLLHDFPQLKILVLGSGVEELNFRALAQQLHIEDSVLWLGRIEPEKLPGYYKTMDILAMPSHWEGFGLSAAEAMAAGVPVVASNVPGLQEVIGDAGKLFPVNDHLRLEVILRELLTNEDVRYRLGKAGQQRVCRLFSAERQAQLWRESYNKLARCK